MAVDRMNAKDLLQILPAESLLAACEPGQLEDLLSRTKVEFAAKREVLMHQGDPGDSAVILVTGQARVNMVSANGREIVLDYLAPGTVIGEIALLDGGERTATVTMVEDGSVMRLTRTQCEDFITSNPGVALSMLQEMARRLRQMNLTVESDRAFSAGPRLARYLQRLTDEEAVSQKLKIDVSQSELGHFVGISRENINRQLSAWADSGLIELDQGKIRIIDCNALWEIAAIGD
ncbi:Crp/Fnr family transcriptional regulator [Parasphingopyxis lamellibrachiae]|uniref:Crp/Fnr family transcriptional regulator n=1 Tax=Parasphingopyxis lamellibrachiae TaxID=680125 RepID=A0A3D9FEC8_9SPHN|nr:Crp/Fnr family transcriptional regulator [Parasphingopyxis lamellibrachiae]RED15406.1 Crp/Fnr family transcriptional regulator [Parasphingopyxis lamellibrachiae]